jgi:hypothetical protein
MVAAPQLHGFGALRLLSVAAEFHGRHVRELHGSVNGCVVLGLHLRALRPQFAGTPHANPGAKKGRFRLLSLADV